MEILERTPRVLRALLGGLSEAWITADEGPGSFRALDVLGHLLHGDLTDWMPRVRHVLAHGDAVPFEPFDRRGHRRVVANTSVGDLLDSFERLREESLADLRRLALGSEDLERGGLHPDLGAVTLGQLLSAWVVHDLGHVRQACRVMARRHADDVGPWRAYLPVLDEGPRRS